MHLRRSARKSACRRRASPRGERAPAPVRPKERVPVPRLPARGACTCAGPPERACTGAAPPREGSVHLRRSARKSVYRRRASPRGERAPAPVRPKELYRCRASRKGACTRAAKGLRASYRRRASPQGERAPPPAKGLRASNRRRASRKGACTRAGSPERASTGAAPPREGSVHLRRTTRQSVCRRAPLRKGSVRPRRPAPSRGRVDARLQRARCAQNRPRRGRAAKCRCYLVWLRPLARSLAKLRSSSRSNNAPSSSVSGQP